MVGSLDQQKVSISINERDVIKLIHEFLENRRIHITQVTLERETGVINGSFSDDVLFLRQLILDGQWDATMQFIEPLKELDGFPIRKIRFLVTKFKYFELLCIKQDPGPLQNCEFAVQEIVECLRELEGLCDAEEFRKLCALLTFPKLSENEKFRSWNPDSARMDCFRELFPLVNDFIDGIGSKKESVSSEHQESSNDDRLVQLIVRGLLYETALTFCHQKALEGKSAPSINKGLYSKMLSRREKLSTTDLSLLSWLEMLGDEQFTIPFQQRELDFRIDLHKKPNLEAHWSEQILSTPIKPGGQFPYSLIPHSRPKFTQKMMTHSMTASLMLMQKNQQNSCLLPHQMSQSTLPSINAFSIKQESDSDFELLDADVLKQSQIISDMLSDASASVLPSTNSDQSNCKKHILERNSLSTSTSTSQIPSLPMSYNAKNAQQELEEICCRNHLSLPLKNQRDLISTNTALAPVPELDTPSDYVNSLCPLPVNASNYATAANPYQSQLFHHFQNTVYNNKEFQHSNPFSASLQQQSVIPHQASLQSVSQPFHNNAYFHPPVANKVVMRHNMQPFNFNNPSMFGSRPVSLNVSSSSSGLIKSEMSNLNAGRPKSYFEQLCSPETNTIMSLSEEEVEEQKKLTAGVADPHIDKSEGKMPVRFVPICRYEDDQAIRAVSFHPSGGHFMLGTNSRKLLLCRYPTVDEVYSALNENIGIATTPLPSIILNRNKYHRGSVYCASFNQTGELLATGSNDKTIRLINIQIENDKCRICSEMELEHVHDGTIRDLIFMEDRLSLGTSSSILISGGAGNCRVCATNCETGCTFRAFQEHTAPILGLYNWGSASSFVSCSHDKTIRFWDLRVSNSTSVIWPNINTTSSRVTSVCVDPSGKLLVSGHEDASVMLFDIYGGRTIQIYRPHGDEVRTVRFSNAAYYLLSGSYDKRITITDMRGNLADPLPYLPVSEHKDKVIQCRWHPRDFVFISTSADKTAVLWSLPKKTI